MNSFALYTFQEELNEPGPFSKDDHQIPKGPPNTIEINPPGIPPYAIPSSNSTFEIVQVNSCFISCEGFLLAVTGKTSLNTVLGLDKCTLSKYVINLVHLPQIQFPG